MARTRTIMGPIGRNEKSLVEHGVRRCRRDRLTESTLRRFVRASPYRVAPGRSRRSALQPKRRDKQRTRSPNHAPHRRTWLFALRDVDHSLRRYSVMQKGLPGRVARITHVAVAPKTATHRQKNQLSTPRTGAQDHTHLVSRDQIRVP